MSAKSTTYVLSQSQYETLCAAAETYRSALIIRLAGEAGLRTGEITQVQIRDLTTIDGQPLLSVRDTAGAVDREVPLSQSIARELARYAESVGAEEETPLIDISSRRVQMLIADTAKTAAERSDESDIADVTGHTLRTFFARQLLTKRAVDPNVVRHVGGWASIRSLEPYLPTVDTEQARRALSAKETQNPNSVSPSETGTELHATFSAIEEILQANNQETVRNAVLTALTGAWQCAWIVEAGYTGDRTTVRSVEGAETTVSTLTANGLRSTSDDDPWIIAETTGKAVFETPYDGATRPLTVGAVPLAHGNARYGVLCVSRSEPTDVQPVERRELMILGDAVGRMCTSFRWRDLLHSDSVTELEFESTDTTDFAVSVSTEFDATFTLDSTVVVSDSKLLCYASVSDVSAKDVATVADTRSDITDLRIVESYENGITIAYLVHDNSLMQTLTNHGGTITEAYAKDGTLKITAEVPTGTDITPIIEGIRAVSPTVRLAGKRTVDRPPETVESVRESTLNTLTDKQRSTLSAAYYGGYFDWPRGSTAEEMADTMGVSSPTFHNHLRKAQRALLDAVFDEPSAR